MCHTGAHALASRVASTEVSADKEKAILALDALLYAEINQPDVRYSVIIPSHLRSETAVTMMPVLAHLWRCLGHIHTAPEMLPSVYLQMANVNSVFAGILRAGLPALLQQTVALLNQPETSPEVSLSACPLDPAGCTLVLPASSYRRQGKYSLHCAESCRGTQPMQL